jgi:hypothetical protein
MTKHFPRPLRLLWHCASTIGIAGKSHGAAAQLRKLAGMAFQASSSTNRAGHSWDKPGDDGSGAIQSGAIQIDRKPL